MKTHEFDHAHLSADLVCDECEAYADAAQSKQDRLGRQWATEARLGIQPTRTRP